MSQAATRLEDRRKSTRVRIRIEPPGVIRVNHAQGGAAIPDAEILNLSEGGAAITSPSPLVPGERIAFNVGGGHAPVLCQVIACDRQADGAFLIRCKCILGGFDF